MGAKPESIIHILFVTDAIREPLTGVGRTARVLLRELHRQGASITAVDWQPNASAEELGIETLALPSSSTLRTGRWHLTLLHRLAKARPPQSGDVLFDPTGYPNAFGHHPNQVLMIHDLSMLQPALYKPGKRTWFRAFQGRSLRKAKALACVSEYTRSQLLKAYRLDAERCTVVPNCLDPELWPAAETDNRPTEPPYFLFVGTFEHRKNLLRLFDAVAMLRANQGPQVQLILAGRPGFGAKAILERANAADLRDVVAVRERPNDTALRQLYRNATCLAFPSLDEGFGLPILEAMAAGIPVLTSNRSATAEVAGDAAILVDPEDVSAITSGLRQLTTDHQERRDLIEGGRRRLQVFDAARSGETLLRLLQSAGR